MLNAYPAGTDLTDLTTLTKMEINSFASAIKV